MFCPSCGVAAQPGQKFCSSCGASLTGVPLTDVREPSYSEPSHSDRPTVAIPVDGGLPPPAFAAPSAPGSEPLSPPLDPTVFDFELYDTTGSLVAVPATTDVVPTQQLGPVTAEVPLTEESQPFGLTPLLILAVLAGALAVLAGVMDQVSYRVTGDVNDSLSLTMNDLSTNSLVACILAAVILIAGASIGATGRRAGVGVVGGTGLAIAGYFGWIVGQDIAIIDTLKMGMAEKGGNYVLTTTYEVGFWLAIGAASLGAVLAIISLIGAADRRPRLHAGVAVVGVLGTLAVMVGPMLPMNGAEFADNFSSDQSIGPARFWKAFFQLTLGIDHPPQPPIATYLRLLVLLLIAVGGLVGFVAGTRWGLGVAAGSIALSVWLWATSLVEAGDLPFGIAGGNPGADNFVPSAVTTIGILAVLVAGMVGAVLAFRPPDA